MRGRAGRTGALVAIALAAAACAAAPGRSGAAPATAPAASASGIGVATPAAPSAGSPAVSPGATAAPGTPSPGSPAPWSPAPASAPTPTGTPVRTPVPTRTPSPTARTPDLAAVRIGLAVAARGLDRPIFATVAGDGSGRLFVAEQGGRIRVLEGGALRSTPFADLSARTAAGGERGLLGLAFSPAFGRGDDRLYVHYTDLAGDTVIAELTAPTGADVEPASHRVLLTADQPYPNHNGGWIGFDGTGMLLVALGDGGSGGDPENRASDLGTLLGKILRVDVLDPSAGAKYGIPSDNPFRTRAGALPEILHYGLRNPFRASVDPATGALWIGDVGQNAWEEISVAPAAARGLDFGWRRWEGRHCYLPASGCSPDGVTMPVSEYSHAIGCSVTGGVVYRGSAIPALRGAYVFADYCSGTIFAIPAAGSGFRAPVAILESGRRITAIGTDEAGELVLADVERGELVRVVPAS